jgi:hypothetical protein
VSFQGAPRVSCVPVLTGDEESASAFSALSLLQQLSIPSEAKDLSYPPLSKGRRILSASFSPFLGRCLIPAATILTPN